MGIRSRDAALLGLALCAGCYQGVEIPLDSGQAADTGIDIDPDDAGPGTTGDAPDPEPPETDEAPAPQLRLLSSHEYENTVRDLLQVEFDNQVEWSDVHTGFDNGGRAQLDEALVSLLLLQSEAAAETYVATRLPYDYPCFSEVALPVGCLEGFVDSFGFRAYRRPLSATDRQGLLDFAASVGVESPTGTELAGLVVTRLLLSPKFLYRVEGGRLDAEDAAQVDDFDRANLIAYTMTGSMPDAMLFADALEGELDDEATAGHVRRLAQTPSGRAQMLRFAQQWFRLSNLQRMRDTPEEFTKLPSPELGPSLAAEFDRFIESTLLASGTLSDLLTSTAYAVDANTAPLYGLPAPVGGALVPVQAPAGRMGVLSLASVLASHASGALVHRDKPIARGMLIKNQLLCEEIGLPSGIDINQAAEDAQGEIPDFDLMTSREQLEAIMNQGEQCIACHQTFMPYGFLSGNYDALGQYQTHFGERALDPSAEQLALDGGLEDYADLAAFVPRLAQSDQLSACYVEQVARFITGSAQSVLTERLAGDFEGYTADEVMLELFEQMLLHPALYERNPTP